MADDWQAAQDALIRRDTFLLNRAIPAHPSLKADALTYDAVVAAMGQPGVGYDPVALFRAAQDAAREVRAEFEQALSCGLDAAREGGWL